MDNGNKKLRILLVGGGTGGHFYPLIGIAEALRHAHIETGLYYAGPDRYDANALSNLAIEYVSVSAGKQRRYTSIRNFFDVFKTFFGLLSALIKLYILYPDVIMSKGGYTSVPVVLAGAFLRIPIVVHESDAVIGRANALAGRFARNVIVAYDEVSVPPSVSAPLIKLGTPVRTALLQNPSANAIAELRVDPNRPIILILGGSQGAERINSLILDSLDELLVDFTIIHQTGTQNFELCKLAAENFIPDEERRQHYHPYPFLEGVILNDAYHLAHIVISRAGSNSIYEIALHGKPSILIPIPESISHDQRSNAYAYARSGGATVMEETNLRDTLLRAEIDRIMQNEELYMTMSKSAQAFANRDSANQIARLLIETAQNH